VHVPLINLFKINTQLKFSDATFMFNIRVGISFLFLMNIVLSGTVVVWAVACP
jgi:hypothetical protein